MRTKHILTLGLLLLTAEATLAQSARHEAARQRAGVNLSLWRKVSTQPVDTVGRTALNLGLFSSMNRLTGLSLNVGAAVVHKDADGVILSGLANVVGGSINGVSATGLSNVVGGDLNGVSAAGLTNIAGRDSRGVTMSALINLAGHDAHGVMLSGLTNIAGRNQHGVAVSGLLNIAGGTLYGMQLSGAINTAVDAHGGIQVGPMNVAAQGHGVQIGLVNYRGRDYHGVQLGLVNANPDTRTQLMLYGGNRTKLNLGVRFKNRLFYTILGGGLPYLDFGDKVSAAAFYRAGLELPVYRGLHVSGDLGYQHAELFGNRHHGLPARLYALQGRINLEYRVTGAFGLFVTGGYGIDRYYNKNATFDKGVIVEGGIVLFKYGG